ncbi:MAG TPA: sugar-binding transcriptional regulator [Atribacteraceae bacterium]|nr:sugar-binding transcriptional regulator [Atribacteraceae bacterium]
MGIGQIPDGGGSERSDPKTERELTIEVARLYYYEELTQDAIGSVLGISRQKVWRLLSRAREDGIVQVRVMEPETDLELREEELKKRYALKEVRLARIFSNDEKVIQKRIAQVAASYLRSRVEPYMTLGISYGKTLFEMTRYLAPRQVPGLRVVQIMGGYGKLKGEVMAIELARRIAACFDGDVIYLLAPAFARDRMTRDAICQENSVLLPLDIGRKADMALVGIGGTTPTSTLLDTGDIHEAEMRILARGGAVGNICGHFYDQKGRLVPSPADERCISLELSELQRIPLVIGVAGGTEKFKAIQGALAGRLVNVLITDEGTMKKLLD